MDKKQLLVVEQKLIALLNAFATIVLVSFHFKKQTGGSVIMNSSSISEMISNNETKSQSIFFVITSILLLLILMIRYTITITFDSRNTTKYLPYLYLIQGVGLAGLLIYELDGKTINNKYHYIFALIFFVFTWIVEYYSNWNCINNYLSHRYYLACVIVLTLSISTRKLCQSVVNSPLFFNRATFIFMLSEIIYILMININTYTYTVIKR